MTEADGVGDLAARIAAAIERRDVATLRTVLAPGFFHRSHGGDALDAEGFLRGIEQIPGEIKFVRLEGIAIDVCSTGALVTGVQHAQVVVAGEPVDERRGFVDWFVRTAGEWRIQAAVDLPTAR